MEVMEKKKSKEQTPIDKLTPREKMDMEKILNWLYRLYQQKKQEEKLD